MTREKPHRRPKTRQAQTQMRDVAEMAGVSAQTVSRYFKSPESLTEHTRKRVADVVAQTGYFPNPAASSLSGNRASLVAIVVPTIDHSIFSGILTGLEAELKARNHQILIAHNAYCLKAEERLVERFLSYKVAGMVLIGQQHTACTRQLLRSTETPTVELLEIDSDPIDRAVGFSNYAAGYDLTERLLRRGRRRIGFISAHPTGNDRVQRRLQGYLDALRQQGLSPNATLIASADFKIENGARAFAEMYRRHPDLDAVISNDILGLGVQLQCERLGLAVPGDIAITGFDNLELASILAAKLTTVEMDSHGMGAIAGRMLLEGQADEGEPSRVIDLGYKIHWRGTTP